MPSLRISSKAAKSSRAEGDFALVQPYSNHIPESQLFKKSLTDAIAAEIVATTAFQRLRHISFLGAISYVRSGALKNAAAKENRFFHSLGVAKIAETFALNCGLPRHERLILVAAGLLHDIGHPPLSHSAESAFEGRFGEDHHSMTERMIRGKERIAVEIPRILSLHEVDPEHVVSLLNGDIQISGTDLFTGPFNVDTLEGISRCSYYMSKTLSESVPSPELVLLAEENLNYDENVAVLDCFWRTKDRVYNTLIRSQMGVIADSIANTYFANYRGKIDRNVMLSTDSELWKRHQKLLEKLYRFTSSTQRKTRRIEYVQRTFVVDESAPASDMNSRYTHIKTPKVLVY